MACLTREVLDEPVHSQLDQSVLFYLWIPFAAILTLSIGTDRSEQTWCLIMVYNVCHLSSSFVRHLNR